MAGTAFATVFSWLRIFLLLLSAYCLMRFVWPRQDRILARGPDRQVDFSRSAWQGMMVGGMQMAYVVLFYVLTTKYLGWWSQVEVNLEATPLTKIADETHYGKAGEILPRVLGPLALPHTLTPSP